MPWSILKAKGGNKRVNFGADAGNELVLCPCDINPGNFKKVGNEVVALDFEATCFMPPAFLAFTMVRPVNSFAFLVAQHINYPRSANLLAMMCASYFLVPCGINTVGQPDNFSFCLD